jgi:hypothetical protein
MRLPHGLKTRALDFNLPRSGFADSPKTPAEPFRFQLIIRFRRQKPSPKINSAWDRGGFESIARPCARRAGLWILYNIWYPMKNNFPRAARMNETSVIDEIYRVIRTIAYSPYRGILLQSVNESAPFPKSAG